MTITLGRGEDLRTVTTTGDQAPTGFSHITKDQLKTIIDAFARITWPAPAQAADRLIAELGWQRVNQHVPVLACL